MHYAIIAAGQGSRLATEGSPLPKPLVELNGQPLIERLLQLFLANGAQSVSVIINEEMPLVRHYLEQMNYPVPLHIHVQSTPDSLHSFYALMPYLRGCGKFCLTTVDPVFPEQEFASYIHAFEVDRAHDALMAVTDYIDDEKPLYVETDADLCVTAYRNEVYPNARYISGGIYCMNERVFPLLEEAIGAGMSRMRNFQRRMVESGLQVHAYPFTKIIDVDHLSDVAKAEQLLKETNE
ncbi:MAG: NDP-sugar synthase [Tannerellaceae bacterium]